MAQILSGIKEQESEVDTFFSSGQLTINAEGPESESNILIVGTKTPLRIKIEVTHPWGRPILHMLVNETNLYILSFPEKRYYLGSLGNFGPSWLFPKRLEPDQLWSLVRGFPVLSKHGQAVSLKGNQITLLNQKAEIVQVIDFYPQSNLPRLVTFPERKTKIFFSNYQRENGICYARDIRLNAPGTSSDLALNLKQMVFNKPIPEAIYSMKKPADFKTLPLK